MNSGMIGGVASAVLTPLVYRLLSKSQTFRQEIPANVDMAALKAKYTPWLLKEIGLAVLSAALLLGAISFGLRQLASLRYAMLPPAVYRLTPDSALWAIYALFLGIVAAAFPVNRLMKWWLGEEGYHEYALYSSIRTAQSYGIKNSTIDSKRLLAMLTAFVCGLSALFLPLTLDYYTLITPTGIVFNPFLASGTQTYTWADIQSITKVVTFRAPNGNPVRNPYFQVRFRDGTDWSMKNDGFDLPESQQGEIANYIAEQSRQRIWLEDPYPFAGPLD